MTHRHWLTFAAPFVAAWLGFLAGNRPPRSTALPRPGACIGIASVNADTCGRAVRQVGGIPVILPNHDHAPTVSASQDGVVKEVLVAKGEQVDSDDLLVRLE